MEQDRSLALGRVRELEEAARSIRERGFTARSFETIAGIALSLDGMFRSEAEKEETLLFPELKKFDPALVRAFNEEHRSARTLFGALLATVRDIEGGRIHGGSVGDLLRTVGGLVTLLRRHLIRERDAVEHLVLRESRGTSSASTNI